jgi:MFS family permease
VGVGRFLSVSMLAAAIGGVFIPLAPDASLVGLACLLAQQLIMDGSLTAFDVVAISVRQGIVEDAALGRVSASFHVLAMAAMLIGTIVGGIVGEVVGLRPALALAAAAAFAGPVIIRFSAAHRLDDLPVGIDRTGGPVEVGVEVSLGE